MHIHVALNVAIIYTIDFVTRRASWLIREPLNPSIDGDVQVTELLPLADSRRR